MSEKIIIAGGSGLIGKRLTQLLVSGGYHVTIITRSIERSIKDLHSSKDIDLVTWDSILPEKLDGASCVINLSGASVGDKRWNSKFKETLYNSRIQTTRKLVDAMKQCKIKPKRFICSSAIGIYGFRGDESLTEDSSTGSDFLAKLCVDWEKEALKAEDAGIRTVCMRTGLVLDKEEGPFPQLYQPFKLFAGGYFASGKQWMSWIHIADIIDLFKFCIENEISGAVNGSAPNPVTNKEFCKSLGKVSGKPCWTNVPGFALKIALGEFAYSLICGQKVLPVKALDHGFIFKYNHLNEALENLLKDK